MISLSCLIVVEADFRFGPLSVCSYANGNSFVGISQLVRISSCVSKILRPWEGWLTPVSSRLAFANKNIEQSLVNTSSGSWWQFAFLKFSSYFHINASALLQTLIWVAVQYGSSSDSLVDQASPPDAPIETQSRFWLGSWWLVVVSPLVTASPSGCWRCRPMLRTLFLRPSHRSRFQGIPCRRFGSVQWRRFIPASGCHSPKSRRGCKPPRPASGQGDAQTRCVAADARAPWVDGPCLVGPLKPLPPSLTTATPIPWCFLRSPLSWCLLWLFQTEIHRCWLLSRNPLCCLLARKHFSKSLILWLRSGPDLRL